MMQGQAMEGGMMHGRMGMSASGSGDSAYRSALRACAAGPAAQRDTCLDSAIARFNRG
jgi:hypothetical protein